MKTIYGGKKKCTPWWTENVRNAVKLKMKTFRKWMKTRQLQDRVSYVEARNEAERVKRREKAGTWRKLGEELKEDHMGTRKLLFNLASNYRGKNNNTTHYVKDKNGNILVEPEAVAGRWREYFEDLLNVRDSDIQQKAEPRREVREESTPPISREEVERIIKKGKAAGEDGIPVELIQAAGSVAVGLLLEIFNEAYKTERIPREWQEGLVCPILKKGDKTACENHRGVTLLSHALKIYTGIIEQKLRGCVEEKLGEWQHGFRPGRGTADLIFTMKMMLEKCWEWNKSKMVLFIDLKKSFDRVNRQAMWNTLRVEHYSIPEKIVRVIKHY